jgi:hypothetical protein
MPDCSYCGASFDDEEAYLVHLRDSHADELGPIDERRISELDGDDRSFATGPIALGIILLIALTAVAYIVVSGGISGDSAGANGPQNVGESDYHGTMAMFVAGQPVDFSRQRYQVQDRAFHFEGGDGSTWHGHATDITLEYAIETLGIEVTNSSIVYDGTSYNQSEGEIVSFEVDGESVPPTDYVIERGDRINVTAAE